MSTAYEELKQRATRRWQELTAGDRPWIRIGGGVSGQASGSEEILEKTREVVRARKLDAEVSLVGALGLMYLEPVLDVMLPGGTRVFYGNVKPDQIEEIIDRHVIGGSPITSRVFAYDGPQSGGLEGVPRLEDLPAWKHQVKIVTRNCGNIDPRDIYQYIANGGYEGLDLAIHEKTPEEIVDEVKASGLRGRGGAAFPTGVKWSFLAPSKAPLKFVLCNCEEGDPGAFNDKGILENDPHTLIEGLIINGYATRSHRGYVFIRQGHDIPIEATREAIQQAYDLGFLGKNILGTDFSFDIEVSLTGDSYVAGEETALMEAIEGKRSTPRFKPPFPAAAGLWQKPTNINNVKTISYVPQIVSKGADWFKSIGTEKSSGTAIVCLTGHIKRPGMYEVPMGLTIRQVLEDVGGGVDGGESIKLLQTGGPLGGVLGPDAFDTQIDFDEMSKAGAILGSGGIIVGNEQVDVVDLIRNLIAFNQFESCGKCFPCRLGNTHMLEVLDRMCKNQARSGDMDLMQQIGGSMKLGSLCGHGQLGFNPISSALKYFGDEFKARIKGELQPSGPFGDGSMILPTRTRP
jgi:NADH:ubiquinone oxidoreductase subunit F (NADH-binding)/(2Fe-2S) ferredoxin